MSRRAEFDTNLGQFWTKFHSYANIKKSTYAMSTDLLRPPATLTAAEALHRSQQAPYVLTQASWTLPWPLSLLITSDAPEKWTIYENLFYSCLRTGDNRSAFMCLERLKERFGESSERVMGLMAVYHEAVAANKEVMENFSAQFQEVINEQPTNMVREEEYSPARNERLIRIALDYAETSNCLITIFRQNQRGSHSTCRAPRLLAHRC